MTDQTADEDWFTEKCRDPEFVKAFLEEQREMYADDLRVAVKDESILWHETLQGKRNFHSDDRVKAYSDVVEAERERLESTDSLTVECPTCKQGVQRNCVVYVSSNMWISAGGTRLEVHPHPARLIAAVRAALEETRQ